MKLRTWQRHVFGLIFAGLVFWGALEAVLRLAPGLVGPPLANWVYTTYGTFPGGIYFREPETGVNFMHPDFTTGNYFNGYRWSHATDPRGFRNPPAVDPQLLLLGDSLIYGHGVEEDRTVTARLRDHFGRPAYNMGRQGAYLYPHYVMLRIYLEPLAPQQVVLFVFANDVDDLVTERTPKEMAQLPETGYDYGGIRRRLRDPELRSQVPLHQQLYRSQAIRLLRGLMKELLALSWVPTAEAAGPAGAVTSGEPLPFVRTIFDDAAFGAAAGYYGRILPELDRRVREAGATLYLAFLDVGEILGPRGMEAQDRIDTLLREIARGQQIPYANTRSLFEACGQDCFLPGDGHLSPEGHLHLASFLDGWLPPTHSDSIR